jgi:hypothetical protein
MKRQRGRRGAAPETVRLNLPTVGVLLAIVGSGAFAAGQSLAPTPAVTVSPSPPEPASLPLDMNETESLPPGHPPVDSVGESALQMMPDPSGEAPTKSLEWHAPERWQLAPNASTMRLATYRVPRVPGDSADAEMSITQAGGSVEANADRWIGQFDAAGQKTAKRSTRTVGSLQVTIVEVQGTYLGGMVKDASSSSGWALLGAIAATPGMPHFLKLTGPAKTVMAARAEFDEMIASLASK